MILKETTTSGWTIALALSTGFVALILLPPFVSEGGREILLGLFSNICHQLPHRSPSLNGVQLSVCHRCTGIYFAVPIAVVLFRVLRGAWPIQSFFAAGILFSSALPSIIDWGGDVAGIWNNTPVSRAATGAVLGLVAGYFFARAVQQIVSDFLKGRRTNSNRIRS